MQTRFQIWGARGSRGTTGSAIANRTSCYSLAVGQDLYVFDAGTGLLELSGAQGSAAKGTAAPGHEHLAQIQRVHLLVTHAHLDHWEGLKDAEWLWSKDNGIELSIMGPKEALDVIKKTCQPPYFIDLKTLAEGTLASLSIIELEAEKEVVLPNARLIPMPLHHYSGIAPNLRHLCTLGYRLCVNDGPTLAYLCDHEPTEKTSEMEDAALSSANLAIVDASYSNIAEHAFGHGSIESAAAMSARYPGVRFLAAHHGPMREDSEIEDVMKQHGGNLPNLSLAVEGNDEIWDEDAGRFVTEN